MVYILNSSILTSFGRYEYLPIDIKTVQQLLHRGFVSAVGHKATAEVLSSLTGVEIPVNRSQVKMSPGDIAIIFKPSVRLEEGKILSKEELEALPYELGLLRML